jgi:hypothetical protein
MLCFTSSTTEKIINNAYWLNEGGERGCQYHQHFMSTFWKAKRAAFLYFQFSFKNFWRKEISEKSCL